MRILMIGENWGYVELIRSTPSGSQAILEFASYHQAMEISSMASVVFVEADKGNPLGLRAGRMIMQRFPSTTLVFLIHQCSLEYSEFVMRMGARYVLVGDEINVALLEQILLQCAHSETTASQDNIARNIERMIFPHNEQDEQVWSAQELNQSFAMEKGNQHFFVMMVTSLDYASSLIHAGTIKKKMASEKIKSNLLQIRDKNISVPFSFCVDQMFYMVVLCQTSTPIEDPAAQIDGLQKQIYDACKPLLGEKQILICSHGKQDFQELRNCLDEIDRLCEHMHCGEYPCIYNPFHAPKKALAPVALDTYIHAGRNILALAKNGRDYEQGLRELFSPDLMERISFAQFMKLKEYMLLDFWEECKMLETDSLRQQAEDILERLQPICNHSYARQQLAQVCALLATGLGKKYNPVVSQCIQLISKKYMTEISLQAMADSLGVCNVYLSSLFRRETGVKFSAYVKEYRLNKAKELIQEGTRPLSQIYEMVGFTSQQYFSKCFKKAFGITPSKYVQSVAL